jgi:hypothetical protein
MSNLLEKASILLTPTAYDDGKILSVKPEEVLGEELVLNGDFATNSNWSLGGGWSIANGVASHTGSGSYIEQGSLTQGVSYKVVINVTQASGSGFPQIYMGGLTTAMTSVGVYTFNIVAVANDKIKIRGLNDCEISSVSVKQEIDGDFDFTRNSSATRVNSQGLIEDVQILSSNLVSNGDFSQEGSELITNGDFATDSDWDKQTSNWTIVNGYAVCDGLQTSNSSLFQDVAVVNGKSYRIDFTITDSVNNLNLILGATTIGQYGSGAHSIYVTKDANASARIFFQATASNNFSGSIDNVSVKEVGQGWTVSNGTITDKYNASMTAYQTGIRILPFSNTGTFKVTFDLVVTSGSCKFDAGGVNNAIFNTSGTKEIIVTDITKFEFNAFNLGWVGTLDNVSVIEITDDTNLPRINYEGFSYQDALGSELVTNGDFSDGTNGWNAAGGGSISVSNNQLTLEGNNDFNFYARQTVSGYEVGKQYRIEVDVAGGSTSKMQVGIYGEGLFFDNQPIVLGKLSAIFTITNGSNGSRFLDIINRNDDGLNDTLIINSVSVKEYLGQEPIPDSGCGSWLFEPQSTNLITQSENFSSVDWTKILVTASANDAASPNGGVNASLIQETVYTSSIPSLKTTDNIPISTGKHTLSFYVKNNNGRYLGISFGNNTNRIRTTFDFDTETFKTPLFNGITEGEVSYTTIGDYYRILITANFTSGISGLVYIMPLATDSYPFFEFQNSDNRSFYLWGAQVEAQSFATSYIPTSGSTVTRLQDAAFGAGSSDLINSTEGVLYINVKYLVDNGLSRKISISDGTDQNRIYITPYQSLAGRIRYIFTNNYSTQADLHFTTDLTVGKKLAFVWALNRFEVWQNGIKVLEDTSGSTPIAGTFNQVSLGSELGNASENFEGELKALAIFKEALTDEELTCLTTI